MIKDDTPIHWRKLAQIGQMGGGRFLHTTPALFSYHFKAYQGQHRARPARIEVSPEGIAFLVYVPMLLLKDDTPLLYAPGTLLNQIDLLSWHPGLAQKIADRIKREVWIISAPHHFRSGYYLSFVHAFKKTLDWLSKKHAQLFFWGDSSGGGLLAGCIQDNQWPFVHGALFYPLVDAGFEGQRWSEKQYNNMFFNNQGLGDQVKKMALKREKEVRHPNISPIWHPKSYPKHVKTLLINAQFDYCYDSIQDYQDQQHVSDYECWPMVHAFWAWHDKMTYLSRYLVRACRFLNRG